MAVALMRKKGKRGPAPRPIEKRRVESIRVMVTGAEKARIAAAAEHAHRGMSDYLRILALEDADRRLGLEE